MTMTETVKKIKSKIKEDASKILLDITNINKEYDDVSMLQENRDVTVLKEKMKEKLKLGINIDNDNS